MASDLSLPPVEIAGWMAEQEGETHVAAAERHAASVERFGLLVEELARAVCDRWPRDSPTQQVYGRRVWTCFEHHWRRLASDEAIGFADMVRRFEAGQLGIPLAEANLLGEVMLAQALELNQSKAAEMFETDYMPDIRKIARRCGGERAVESVENFAADLILPRQSARAGTLPSRIASFQGRTALRSWLRAVIVHGWISQARKASPAALPDEALLADSRPTAPAGSRDCEQLLRPVFAEAVGRLPAEDRLLVKMLVLDGVPQQALARTLGIHSGNVTRRRQRVLEQILAHVHRASPDGDQRQSFAECVEAILTGQDRSLHQTLGALLAEALGQATGPAAEEG